MATGTTQLNGYDDNLGDLVLSSRPGWATLAPGLFLASLLLVLACFPYLAPPQSFGNDTPAEDMRITLLFGSISLIFLTLSVCAFLIPRIEIYDKGLSWRGFRGRRQALWSEITDYYLLYAESKRHYRVETTNGSKLSFSDAFIAWRDYKRIPEEIQNRAIPTKNMPWEEKGGRRYDPAPTVFKYNKKESLFFLLLSVLGALAIPILAIDSGWLTGIIGAYKGLGVLMGILLVILLIPMLFTPILHAGLVIGETWTARPYKNDRIEITPDTITVHSADSTRSYRWQDVVDIRVERSGKLNSMGNLVIYFADGWQYPIFKYLTDRATFRRRIETLSGKKVRNLAFEASDDLGKEADRWSSGVVGLGSRRFHYRTRFSRAFSFLPLTLCVAFFLIDYTRPEGGAGGVYILGLVLLPVYFYCLWRYWKAAILVDDIGITQLAPFGQIVIRWDEIGSVTYVSGDLLSHYRIDGKGRKIRIYISLSHLSEFLNLIREKGFTIEGK